MLDKKIISLVKKFNSEIDTLNNEIVEKEEFINLCKIAIIAQRNLFVLGKPGLSKTYVIDKMVEKFKDLKYYKTLMTKEKSQSQLFGKIDLKSLIQGEPQVSTKNMIPEANINFIDEIFKGNDICLNSLLQVLNFEKLSLEGTEGVKAPTICSFAASNEIPDFDDEDNAILKPLYDRLHLKFVAEPIQNKENYFKAVKAKREKKSNHENTTKLTLSDIQKLNEATKSIRVSDECDEIMWKIAQDLNVQCQIYVSDRKLIEYSSIVQAAALLDGRDEVIPSKDFTILKYYLWDKENQIADIEKIIESNTKDEFIQLMKSIEDGLYELHSELNDSVINLIKSNNGIENCSRPSKLKIIKNCEESLSQTLAALYSSKEQYKKNISENGQGTFDTLINKIESIAKEVANSLQIDYCSIQEVAKANRLI